MQKAWIAGLFGMVLFLSACAQQVTVQCNTPYSLIDNVCCLDENKNGICDDKEIQTKEEAMQLPQEQPSVVINPPKEPVQEVKEQPKPEQPKEQQAKPETSNALSTQTLLAKMDTLKSYAYVFEGKSTAIMGNV